MGQVLVAAEHAHQAADHDHGDHGQHCRTTAQPDQTGRDTPGGQAQDAPDHLLGPELLEAGP